MVLVRRWYVFLVCAISLQAVAWATISLLQSVLAFSDLFEATSIALQSALIVVGLPIYLAHWLWAQRLAGRDADERASALRRLYLYAMQAGFLVPVVVGAADLARFALQAATGIAGTAVRQSVTDSLVVLIIAGVLWAYHAWVTVTDSRLKPDTGNAALVRRWYVLAFSALGAAVTFSAAITLLGWILTYLGASAVSDRQNTYGLTEAAASALVGLPLWLIFWRWAQRLFAGPSLEERESALRKFYLYALVLSGVVGTVSNATMILAGLLRSLLGLQPEGELSGPLSVIIGMAVLWAYHSVVLRADAAQAAEAPRQAGVRRLYLYLVGAVGLAAVLIGLGGDLSVLIRALTEAVFDDGLREQLAWFTAGLVAGLPVWVLPWRQAQAAAVAQTAAGVSERQSVVRKIYLYFFLFAATLTVLAGAVYVVFRIFRLVLGESGAGNVPGDLGQAIAFSLIGVGVWIYHGLVVRGDGRRNQQAQADRWRQVRVAILDFGDGRLGRSVLDAVQRELPTVTLDPIGLTPAAAAAMGAEASAGVAPETWAERLAKASVIVGPWEVAVAGGGAGAVTAELTGMITRSAAHKLLIPVRVPGWDWAGVDRWDADAQVRQTVAAVRQIAEGEPVQPSRPLGVGAIIGLVVVGLVVLTVVVNVLAALFQ
ncbi:MAG: DUF3842 family protein [Anaerolineales bacterium]|nr:DUF3842 family protein [Anaerolineales bacterium]